MHDFITKQKFSTALSYSSRYRIPPTKKLPNITAYIKASYRPSSRFPQESHTQSSPHHTRSQLANHLHLLTLCVPTIPIHPVNTPAIQTSWMDSMKTIRQTSDENHQHRRKRGNSRAGFNHQTTKSKTHKMQSRVDRSTNEINESRKPSGRQLIGNPEERCPIVKSQGYL